MKQSEGNCRRTKAQEQSMHPGEHSKGKGLSHAANNRRMESRQAAQERQNKASTDLLSKTQYFSCPVPSNEVFIMVAKISINLYQETTELSGGLSLDGL